ncbi:MAG: hypothetical protein M0Z69_04025 [Actinomycetota bacterium]|nr:hypothetical protein [Actinomycetota bacterium]
MSARSISYVLGFDAAWQHEELEIWVYRGRHHYHRLTAGDLSVAMSDEQFRDLIAVIRAAEVACYDTPPYDNEALLHFPRPQVPGQVEP